MDDCIFCKIASHVIESDYVYEDDRVCACRDLSPLAPTHVLVIPKHHYETMVDGVAPEDLVAMTHAVEEVVKSEGIAETGFRVVTNGGADAGQAVHHLHWHVLGGRRLTDDFA